MKAISLVLTGVALFGLGCGGSKSETKADQPPTAQEAMVAAPSQDDLTAHCVKFHEQLFLCKDQAIDMLMEERGKANPDFAKGLADAAQKATMREQGLKELETDGGGDLEPRQAKCKEMASKMPAQVPESMVKEMKTTESCWDKPCADRANCLRTFSAMMIRAMPAPAAEPAPAAAPQ
jgi:uncharacterized protein (DUF305 family)